MFGLEDWRPAGRTPRVISLTRVSTDAQKDNTSHDVQREYNERWCERVGWELVLHLEETVSGALYLAREQTQLALEMLERDEADALLLFDMTRYGRDVEFQHKILKRIVRRSKRLYIATLPLEYDPLSGELTPESQDIFNNAGGSSASERARIKRRMNTGREKNVAKGIMPIRANAPFGYHIVQKADIIRQEYPPELEGRYVVVEERARWIPVIFEMYDRNASLRAICRMLETQGVKTARGNSGWYPSTILDLLQNTAYYGRPAYGRKLMKTDEERRQRGLSERYEVKTEESTWRYLEAPALIDEALWQRCQQRVATAQSLHSGRRDRRYLLSGLLRCPECGTRLAGRGQAKTGRGKLRQKPLVHYHCTVPGRRKNTTAAPCQLRRVSATVADALVIEAIAWLARQPEISASVRDATRKANGKRRRLKLTNGESSVAGELERLERRERAAAESRIEAKINGTGTDVYDKILLEVQQRRQELQRRQAASSASSDANAQALNQIRTVAESMVAALQSADLTPVEKRELLCLIVDRIDCTYAQSTSKMMSHQVMPHHRQGIARAQHLRIRMKAQVPVAIHCDGTKGADRFRLTIGQI